MNREEMLAFLKNEAQGIAKMFGPNCETIVHDMTRPGHPILAIYNGTVTGREIGSTADIFGDIGDYDETIYKNKDYTNQLVLSRDGRTLKSSTFNIVGDDFHFALGINMDITNMVRATQMLTEMSATSGCQKPAGGIAARVRQRRGQGARPDEEDGSHAHHPHALQAPRVHVSEVGGNCR